MGLYAKLSSRAFEAFIDLQTEASENESILQSDCEILTKSSLYLIEAEYSAYLYIIFRERKKRIFHASILPINTFNFRDFRSYNAERSSFVLLRIVIDRLFRRKWISLISFRFINNTTRLRPCLNGKFDDEISEENGKFA